MTALLQPRAEPRTAPALARSFGDRVSNWGDPHAVADAAAELLREELGRATISVLRVDPGSGELLLLGCAPRGEGRAPQGSRSSLDLRGVDLALRDGIAQRTINYYVEPDFVRSVPGDTRSALAVPVGTDRGMLGIIHLEYAAPAIPSTQDQETAELIAGLLAPLWAISGAASTSTGATDASAERRLRQAGALASVSGALAKAEDFDEPLTRIVASAAELTRCGGALLLVRHPSRQMLQVVASAGSLRLEPGTLVPMDGTLPGQVSRQGAALSVAPANAPADPILPQGLVEAPLRDGVILPVASGGKTRGVLVAVDSADGSGFGVEDVQLLQALADQAGTVEALSSIPALRQRISDASLVAEVGRAMTGTLGLDEVLALVVRAAEMLVSGRFAAAALLSKNRSELVVAGASGSLQGKTGQVIDVLGSVLGWVAMDGESIVCESLAADPRGWPLGENAGPGVLVPLESRGQILGVLLAGRAVGAEPPSDGDLDAVRKLAAHAAIAIDNARLYQEQTELSQTLRLQAQELEKAYVELGTSQERLLVSEKMAALGRVTAGIAHEINSPLGSILNCLQLATTYAQEYHSSAQDPEVTPADHQNIATDLIESLTLAEEATRRVGQFVRTIKDQTRMDDEQVEVFDPAEEIERTLLLLRHGQENEAITIEAELVKGLELRGDASKFALIVQNLVSNATDAYENGAGTVRLRLRREGEAAVLEVQDEGSGIPEDIRPRIFDYLFTTKDVGRGTGLGLSLAHSTVTSHFRGSIDFSTEVGAGTTFVVIVPLNAEN